jgi:hypothetical protein
MKEIIAPPAGLAQIGGDFRVKHKASSFPAGIVPNA